MRKILITLMLILIMTGCSNLREISKEDKEVKVRKNLTYLNNFQGKGVLEISFKGLSLKKEFILKKKHAKLRLDVLDSGILSLIPSPLASLYIDKQIILTNYNKGIFPDLILDNFPLSEFLDFDKLPQGIIDEIVKNRQFTLAIIRFEFDENYRLDSINLNEERVKFIYLGNDLSKIEVESPKADINIIFDEFEPGEFTIKPLVIQNIID